MVFKFLWATVGKYHKLPLGMHKPTVNNEKRKMHVSHVKKEYL